MPISIGTKGSTPSKDRSQPPRLSRLVFAGALLTAIASLHCSGGGGSDGESIGSPPARVLDLATLPQGSPALLRVHGSVGEGNLGVPVTGAEDVDGDGNNDVALAAMRADPQGRTNAGAIFLAFGGGTFAGPVDTLGASADVLEIHGAAASENAGSEIWMGDLTGDGLAELVIARQNFTPDPSRIGAGAVTILIGGSGLADHAATLAPLDLAGPPPAGVNLLTLVGGEPLGRFGMWVRMGDVTGDGIDDLLIGADQEDAGGGAHSGAVYLVRGGAHLLAGDTVDLMNLATALPGNLAKVIPPASSAHFHFGASHALADLDGNGPAELMIAATLNRVGGTQLAEGAPSGSAHGIGGAPDGRLYIVWDDNFAGVWPPGFTFSVDMAPGSTSEIRGGAANISFGEEVLGGLDFDNDGNGDLFVGDIVGDLTPGRIRPNSGGGHLFYNAASLRNRPAFSLDSLPGGVTMTTFLGPAAGDIATDTALQGDFDDDGFPDLAFSSPHGGPPDRSEAGIVHILHGQSGPWPTTVDLRWGKQPDPSAVRMTEIHGAKARDVLCYSADAGDYDGDGVDDLIVNEMLGDGLTSGINDVGNVIVISGTLIRDLP